MSQAQTKLESLLSFPCFLRPYFCWKCARSAQHVKPTGASGARGGGAPSAPFSSAGGGARALKVSQDGQKSRTLVLAAAPEGQKSRTLVLQAAPVAGRDTELIVWGGGLGTKVSYPRAEGWPSSEAINSRCSEELELGAD